MRRLRAAVAGMAAGRRAAPLLALCLVLLATSPAHPFWPFGGGGDSASGLDLNRGYDVNTVTTISGRVLSLAAEEGGGPALVEVRAASGAIYCMVGPRWFWNDNGIPLQVGDEITARGSLSEGKDGRRYLLVQKLGNQRTGDEVVLRDDDGVPVWSRQKRPPGQGGPTDKGSPKPGGRTGSGPRGRR